MDYLIDGKISSFCPDQFKVMLEQLNDHLLTSSELKIKFDPSLDES